MGEREYTVARAVGRRSNVGFESQRVCECRGVQVGSRPERIELVGLWVAVMEMAMAMEVVKKVQYVGRTMVIE